jgi:tetratricopeptide (TPR) repeat protein
MEVVRLADAVQQGSVRSMLEPPLGAYAFWLEDELRLEEALDVVDTALGLTAGSASTEEIAALLQRGRILRKLGQLTDATASYQAARNKAVTAGDTHSVLLSRIGEAIVMKQLGNLSGSEEVLRGVLAAAEGAGDADAQARAHHDLGAVFIHMRRPPQAVAHLYRAFELYEQPPDRYRALSDLGEGLRQLGRYGVARDAFRIVLRHGKTEELRASAMIALLEISAQMRDRVGFTNWKRQIGALAGELPAERQALFHLQLGLGCAGFGQVRAAERALRKAATTAEQHHLNEYAFRVEAALAELKKTSAPNVPETPVSPEAEDSTELAEMAGKLHALAG